MRRQRGCSGECVAVIALYAPLGILLNVNVDHYIFFLTPQTHSSQVYQGAMVHHAPQVFASAPHDFEWVPRADNADCTSFFQTFDRAFWYLLESSLTGDDFYQCLRAGPFPNIITSLFGLFYYVFLCVLLLNMLIAMHARADRSRDRGPRRAATACQRGIDHRIAQDGEDL